MRDICHLHPAPVCLVVRVRVCACVCARQGGVSRALRCSKWVVMMRSYNTENYRDNTNKWHTWRLSNSANAFFPFCHTFRIASKDSWHRVYLHECVGGFKAGASRLLISLKRASLKSSVAPFWKGFARVDFFFKVHGCRMGRVCVFVPACKGDHSKQSSVVPPWLFAKQPI